MSKQAVSTASKGEYWITILIALGVIVLDQLSKWWIEANLDWGQALYPIESLATYFRILHVHNTGAAFGMFQGGGWFFSIVAIGVSIFVIIYNFRLDERQILMRIAMGLMLGGALGNVIDRFRLGHVTDFIHINLRPLVADYPLLDFRLLDIPVFNVADMAVVSGVFMLAVLTLFEEEKDQTEEADTPEEESDYDRATADA